MDKTQQFYQEIYDQQLITVYSHSYDRQDNFLDLNEGKFYAPSDHLQKIYDLAKVYGMGKKVAELVCHIDKLNDPHRRWYRPYHTDAWNHPEQWVRLDTLLEV